MQNFRKNKLAVIYLFLALLRACCCVALLVSCVKLPADIFTSFCTVSGKLEHHVLCVLADNATESNKLVAVIFRPPSRISFD